MELYHHGIQGQKWGVRNGPPYPLSRSSLGRRRWLKNASELQRSEPDKYRHLRIDNNTKGYAYKDRSGKTSAVINVETKSNGQKWIQGVEIFDEHKGKGHSKKLLDVAIKDLGAEYLSVNKKNKVAKHIYDKYGFKVYDETEAMYMMRYKRKKK